MVNKNENFIEDNKQLDYEMNEDIDQNESHMNEVLVNCEESLETNISSKLTNEGNFNCNKSDISENNSLNTESDEIFVCNWNNKCKYKSYNKKNYRRHYLNHKNIRQFKCDFEDCDKSYDTFNNLELHKCRVHSIVGQFACLLSGCGLVFRTKRELNIHENNHKNRLKAKEFSKKFYELTKEQLLDYIKTGELIQEITKKDKMISVLRPKDSPKDNFCFRCNWSECVFFGHRKVKVKEHIVTKHTNEKQFVCDKCGKEFTLKRCLSDHKKFVHPLKKGFKCEWNECQYETNRKVNLDLHYLRHMKVQKYKCDFEDCDKKFVSFREMRLHKSRVHLNLRPYVCVWPGCEATFKELRVLKSHQNSHIGNRPFKCDHNGCQLSFFNAEGLRRHKLLHKPKRKYACHWPQCDHSFIDSAQLRYHIARHRGELPFGCQWSGCQKSFQSKKLLTEHMTTHENNTL